MPRISIKLMSDITKPESGQKIYRDSELKGFGLRVTPGSMSYIVESRVSGSSRRVTIAKCDEMTPEQARREARRILGEMSQNKMPTPKKSPVTLQEVLDSFLDVRKLKPNSVRSYRSLLERGVPDWLDLPITSITYEMVHTRHKELTKPTRMGTSGQYQANAVLRTVGCLINFAADNFENADGQSIIIANPVRKLTKNRGWHKEHRRRNILPDHKLRSWYQTVMLVRQHKVRDFLLFTLLTGLRKNEAATLEWKDVDLHDPSILIRHDVAKNGEEHRLPLSPFLVLLLKQRKVHTGNSKYVFPGQSGNDHLIDCGEIVDRVIRESGCDFVLHDLRRTFISMAARLSLPRNVIKKLVNHISGLDSTDGYIVLHPEHLREPMNQITEKFLSLFGTDLSDWQTEPVHVNHNCLCTCVKLLPPH